MILFVPNSIKSIKIINMKHITYIVVFALSLCSVPLCAETSMSDDARSSASDIQPFSGNYSYAASSPVDIQLSDFSLAADSGSLKRFSQNNHNL